MLLAVVEMEVVFCDSKEKWKWGLNSQRAETCESQQPDLDNNKLKNGGDSQQALATDK